MLKSSPVISKSVVLFLISVLFINECNANDKTTCMTENGEKSDELHFVCYCINEYQEDVMKHAEDIADHPGFSLAHFAYNLAGSYFGKTVHIRFVSRVKLGNKEQIGVEEPFSVTNCQFTS